MFLFRRGEQRVSIDEARTRTGGDKPEAVLLDVREKPEWKAGHAPGAVHAPLTGLVSGAALPRAARGRPLVVICRSGHRSQQAAKAARRPCLRASRSGERTPWTSRAA